MRANLEPGGHFGEPWGHFGGLGTVVAAMGFLLVPKGCLEGTNAAILNDFDNQRMSKWEPKLDQNRVKTNPEIDATICPISEAFWDLF